MIESFDTVSHRICSLHDFVILIEGFGRPSQWHASFPTRILATWVHAECGKCIGAVWLARYGCLVAASCIWSGQASYPKVLVINLKDRAPFNFTQ